MIWNYNFQKWILSQFISAPVHFNAVVVFSLVFNQNSGHKILLIQENSENKTTNGGEKDKRSYYTESGADIEKVQTFKLVVSRTPVYILIPKSCLQIGDFAGLQCTSGLGLFQMPPSDGSNVNPWLVTYVLTDILEKVGTQKSSNIQCSLQCNFFSSSSSSYSYSSFLFFF